MKALGLVVLGVLLAAGCGEKVSATVDCVVTKQGSVDCSVQQTQGTSEIEVCWDFGVTCASGATLTAERACGTVKDGGTSKVTIPADKVTIEGSCEGELTAKVTNMSWKAK